MVKQILNGNILLKMNAYFIYVKKIFIILSFFVNK